MCNARSINVSAKQINVVCWHISSGNIVSFVTETKLRSSSALWIKDKYDEVRIFTSGLDVGYLGASVVVIMNNSLVCHVSKIEVVPGRVILVWLLFKGKLSVSVLSLYADASAGICFEQASEVNSIIAKAVNTSTFVVLGKDFNEYHNAVVISVSLEGLLDVQLNGLCKQANKNCWKFKIKDVDSSGWSHFRDYFSIRILIIKNRFLAAATGHDLDTMWLLLKGALLTLDANKALVLRNMVYAGQKIMDVLKYLSIVRKGYKKSKMYESKLVQKASIRAAIEKHMEKFCLDKGNIISSVLDRLFRKMVLDHLVVDDELVLNPDGYALLDYVTNNAFSGVMDVINMSELLVVVGGLPNSKAIGLSGIPNKLWKHGGKSVMECFLVLHEHLCGYQINTKFVAKSGRIESSGGMSSFFVAGVFVDNTIWIGNCQTSMQYVLDIASEFFLINDISINSKKTVAIPINQSVKVASLDINGQSISIAKRGKTHRYLEIFLSTEGLSKSSLAKTHSDVRFFTNVVLKKAITDKQFSYLVSAVLQPIVNYHTQFSFVSLNVCCNFALSLIVLGWAPLDLLQFSVKLHVSPVNNFLAGMVKIFLGNELSLSGSFEIFMNGSLKNFGSSSIAGGAATYFLAIDCSIGVKVHGLMFSTLAKLQTVALVLECVPSSSVVTLHFDSQAVIDMKKDLSISWVKVKSHSGVCGNIKADAAAGAIACSRFFLSIRVQKRLLIAENMIVSGNACYFVRNLEVELPDHAFSCAIDADVQNKIIVEAAVSWVSLGFVMSNWCSEAVEVFKVGKIAVGVVVNFVRNVVELHCHRVWLI
ncbi:hypothetical protein G9A89_015778 [Geosiphon pyriformis]|nr:hypothetical protein G9A89_015778 [Geosiphon pyriformis]